MKITTDHSTISYGIPVFLDDAGQAMNYSIGIKALRKKLGLNTTGFGEKIGVSGRTVEDWEQGRRMPGKPALKLMAKLLEE